jgi:hypothetical protein
MYLVVPPGSALIRRQLPSGSVPLPAGLRIRLADLDDVDAIGRLLHDFNRDDFNREFDEPTR